MRLEIHRVCNWKLQIIRIIFHRNVEKSAYVNLATFWSWACSSIRFWRLLVLATSSAASLSLVSSSLSWLCERRKKKEQIIETNYVAKTENHDLTRGGKRIERFLVLILRAKISKVVQTNGRLMHHSDNFLFLLLKLLDLLLVLFQFSSGRFQIIIQTNLVLRMIVV